MDNVKHIRVSRLLSGARRDLESALAALAAQAVGWTSSVTGKPIADEIASLRSQVDALSKVLAGLS
jgi:hypothetical protein